MGKMGYSLIITPADAADNMFGSAIIDTGRSDGFRTEARQSWRIMRSRH